MPLSLSLSLSWWISLQTLVLKHFVREGMLQEFCLGEPLKKFNKKIEYIELLTQKKKKWSFTTFFYKFSNFKLLYDSSLWVSIANVGSYEAIIILFC